MNRHLLFRLFSIIIFLISSNIAWSAEDEGNGSRRIVLANEPITDIGPYLQTLKDPKSNLSPYEIILPQWSDQWMPVAGSTLNFGYDDNSYWIRMVIDASASIYKQWDLTISSPLLDYVDVYQVFRETGPRLIYRSGMKRAFNNRLENHRFFIVPLDVYNDPKTPSNFLIHIKTDSPFYVPMELYPANDFWEPLQKADILNWMFFGFIIAMALYNLFLYASVRDVSYLYYVFFIASFAMLHLSLDGYIFQYYWPEEKPYNSIINTIFSSLSILFGFLFITYFLDFKKNMLVLHRTIIFAAISQIPIAALFIFYPDYAVGKVTVPILGFLLFLAVCIGVYGSYKGLIKARYFLGAWLMFALGNFYLISVFLGSNFIPIAPLTASKFASYAEAMLLSFALAHRIRTLRDEREKQQVKSDAQRYFLAQISHEIRTPLNGVLGTVDLLHQTELNVEQESYVKTIKKSGKSLLNLVNDVLDYSKLEAGKMILVTDELVPIRELADQLLKLFKSQAYDKKLDFILTIDSKVPEWIQSDAQRVRQIWSNLISNAIKFTDEGFVKVHLYVKKGDSPTISLSVKDSGSGIDEDLVGTLFTAYQQIDLDKNRVAGGTGLGLAISKELVELLGGSISVETQVNVGSEFTVDIPLVQVTNSAQYISDTSGSDHSIQEAIRPLSILVAEDNVVNQKVVCGLLDKLGHQSVVVDSGDEAVNARMNRSDFDLILMDCEMPTMDGYEATINIRRLEKDGNLTSIPIIALTAHALEEVRQNCIQSGMNAFLTKPINLNQLSTVLNQFSD